MRSLSISQRGSLLRVQGASARWIAAALALTAAAWLAALAGLLAIANRVHDDVPYLLAIKLPLLQSRPELIFAGESRTVYQLDAGLAAHVQSAAVYPQDVAARLGVVDQMSSFLPLRVGTLIRFIREAFGARLAADQHLADFAPLPAALGLKIIDRTQPDDRWPAEIGSHAHYANWDLSGPKARFEIGALCDMVVLTRKLTVVVPPWAPRYDRARDPSWRDKDDQYAALVVDAGRRCGFDVLNIQSIPGLDLGNYADEMHVNASGVPIYTRYIVSRLKR